LNGASVLACRLDNPKNKNAVLYGNRQGQEKGARKRKVAPPEAAASGAAVESSASEEDDSSVSDDFQP
jgi:hypothetical protein